MRISAQIGIATLGQLAAKMPLLVVWSIITTAYSCGGTLGWELVRGSYLLFVFELLIRGACQCYSFLLFHPTLDLFVKIKLLRLDLYVSLHSENRSIDRLTSCAPFT